MLHSTPLHSTLSAHIQMKYITRMRLRVCTMHALSVISSERHLREREHSLQANRDKEDEWMNYETKKIVQAFKASVQRRLGTLHTFFLHINFIIMFFYLSIFFVLYAVLRIHVPREREKKKWQSEAHIGLTEISSRLLFLAAKYLNTNTTFIWEFFFSSGFSFCWSPCWMLLNLV